MPHLAADPILVVADIHLGRKQHGDLTYARFPEFAQTGAGDEQLHRQFQDTSPLLKLGRTGKDNFTL